MLSIFSNYFKNRLTWQDCCHAKTTSISRKHHSQNRKASIKWKQSKYCNSPAFHKSHASRFKSRHIFTNQHSYVMSATKRILFYFAKGLIFFLNLIPFETSCNYAKKHHEQNAHPMIQDRCTIMFFSWPNHFRLKPSKHRKEISWMPSIFAFEFFTTNPPSWSSFEELNITERIFFYCYLVLT